MPLVQDVLSLLIKRCAVQIQMVWDLTSYQSPKNNVKYLSEQLSDLKDYK